jgi:DNA repair protein RecN (Recombination protein N)
MLELLRIQNLALIEDLELEFSSGLNVLTGETGAGKSFILRALDFVLGEKLPSESIRPGEDRARVEALFSLPEGDYAIKREILRDKGRSRIYINDSLSSQDKVRELRPRLLMHTSQHGQQRLLTQSYHTRILDARVSQELLAERDELLEKLRHTRARHREIGQRAKELEERREFLEYQEQEIQKVDPQPGEEEELEERKRELREQARSMEGVQRCLELLEGQEHRLLDNMVQLHSEIASLADRDGDFADEAYRLEEMRHELQELAVKLRDRPPPLDTEQELERIESRMWELGRLKRKLGRSLEEISGLQTEIRDNLDFLDNCNLELQQLDRRERELVERLGEVVQRINRAREEAAGEISASLQEELRDLGFAQGMKVTFEFNPVQLAEHVAEQRARLMWMPNPGHPPQPLDQIASGGELSRFLLALVGLFSQEQAPTLLFDEVDAGIGGVTLSQVGHKIGELARRQQVILISHWPQLACLASKHFLVFKEVEQGQTSTRCRSLSGKEVEQELARMAGGGEQGRLLADKLLQSGASDSFGGSVGGFAPNP